MSIELDAWIEGYRRAWETADADAVAELFAEDATYRAHIFHQPHVGRDAIRAYWRRATATQRNVLVRMGRPYIDADRVAVEWWTTMLDEGEEVTMPGCLLLRFATDGRCSDLWEYWQDEPGLRDPPAGWGQ